MMPRISFAGLALLLGPLWAGPAFAEAVDAPGTISRPARHMVEWVAISHDNHGMPFLVIDKAAARVFAFDAAGQFRGGAPALLGLARGDETSPGIGERELSSIRPNERVTEAGRFLAKFGPGSARSEVLWINPLTRLSLHPVLTANARERRWDRLKSPTTNDNRITFGCINVSAAFYYDLVRPVLGSAQSVVYILPETKRLSDVFPMLQYQATAGP